MKILHLPTNTGGMAWSLSMGERSLGYDSRVMVRFNNLFAYPCDYPLNIERNRNLMYIYMRLCKSFLQFRRGFDVYHFNYGSTLIDAATYNVNLLDLPFYSKKARKFVTYNGCDARQKYATIARTNISACHEQDCYNGLCMNRRREKIIQKRIKKMEAHVDHFFAVNPDLLWFLPEGSTFLPYTVSGFDEIEVQGPVAMKKRLTLVHAPTNRVVKGSKYILEAIQRIQRANPGLELELILVENMSHEEALRIYQKADLVIDQLLVGWYGGLAVEVMKMGKPVIAYIREEDLQFIPEAMKRQLPIINANPNTIEQVLLECIDNPALLRETAAASLDYVHRWHNPRYVAGITTSYYER